MTKIAIIRIAGEQGLVEKIKTTFKLLNLHKKYTCVLVPNTPQIEGMLKVIKDHVTWGEIDKETLAQLLEKRGKLVGNKQLTNEYLQEKIKLPAKNKYGIGMFFIPKQKSLRTKALTIIENTIHEQKLKLLGWRNVPVNEKAIGTIAKKSCPLIS